MASQKSQYLARVLESHRMSHVQDKMDKINKKATDLKEALKKKFSGSLAGDGNPLNSGSYAKHTAINRKFDFDFTLPFKYWSYKDKDEDDKSGLEAMYNAVFKYLNRDYQDSELLRSKGYPKKQRVSIGLLFEVDGEEIDIDVVPGRERTNGLYGSDTENLDTYDIHLHVIPKPHEDDAQSWLKTNIKKHIDHISGPKDESRAEHRKCIRLLKVWKTCHNKPSKSFFVELLVIRAFEQKSETPTGLWPKLEYVLEYFEKNVESIKLVDPANKNNVVSDTLSEAEKEALKNEISSMRTNIAKGIDWLKYYFPVNEEFDGKDPGASNSNLGKSGRTYFG